MNTDLTLSPSLTHHHVLMQVVPKFSFANNTLPFEEWQEVWREELRGLLKMPQQKAPLNPRTLWKREHALGTIEKVVFTSEPMCDVTGYLCLPKDSPASLPAVICLQGHTSGAHVSVGLPREDDGHEPITEGDRDFGLQCMKLGIAALCIEQRSFGERREQHQEHVSTLGCQDAAMHALMLGRTLAGERVFDVDCAVDYLESRGDIDMSRVGIMGNSGGGTISIYSAALLDRIRFAMPSCSFATFADSIMSIFHCADNYVPDMLKYGECADVLGLAAPKPVVIVSGVHDDIFPIESARRAFQDVRKIYAAAGAPDLCHLLVGEAGHRFYADLGWPHLLAMVLPEASTST